MALADGAQNQVDDYVYMEVGKDLRFGAELYGFFTAADFITSFLITFRGFQVMWYLYVVGEMTAIAYICMKFIRYDKKLKLFR